MGDRNAMMGGLVKYTKALSEMRRQMLEAKWEDFKKAVKKEVRIVGPVNPTVGDVVMIKSDSKINYSRFWVIVQLNSPTTMTIRTRYATGVDLEERPVNQVVPIVGKSLPSEVKELGIAISSSCF